MVWSPGFGFSSCGEGEGAVMDWESGGAQVGIFDISADRKNDLDTFVPLKYVPNNYMYPRTKKSNCKLYNEKLTTRTLGTDI